MVVRSYLIKMIFNFSYVHFDGNIQKKANSRECMNNGSSILKHFNVNL